MDATLVSPILDRRTVADSAGLVLECHARCLVYDQRSASVEARRTQRNPSPHRRRPAARSRRRLRDRGSDPRSLDRRRPRWPTRAVALRCRGTLLSLQSIRSRGRLALRRQQRAISVAAEGLWDAAPVPVRVERMLRARGEPRLDDDSPARSRNGVRDGCGRRRRAASRLRCASLRARAASDDARSVSRRASTSFVARSLAASAVSLGDLPSCDT